MQRDTTFDDENKAIFRQLEAAKPEVEMVYGGPLEWECLDDRRFVSIKKNIAAGGYRDDESQWPKIHVAMVDAMIILGKALQPQIDKLKF